MKLTYGTQRIAVPFPLSDMTNNHILFDFAQRYLKRQLWFDPGNGIDSIVEDISELWFCCKLLEMHFNANMESDEWNSIQETHEDAEHTEACERHFETIESSEEEYCVDTDEDAD